MKHAHFSPDALHFLADLARHNNRDWFEKYRDRYERSLQTPYVKLLEDLKPKLAKVSPKFVVDAKPNGGSLARIHRDMRFVRDGLPFKSFLSAHFAHEKAKDGAAPSFFLSLQPGNSYVAAGLRAPDGAAAKKLKAAIDDEPERWRKLTRVGDLDRFVVRIRFTDEDVASEHFLDDVVRAMKRLAPFVAFVSEAVGLRV